jgi:hypothetical protein
MLGWGDLVENLRLRHVRADHMENHAFDRQILSFFIG